MPDVNLLRDTKQPVEQHPKRRDMLKPELSDPSMQPKRGLGDALRSLLGRRSASGIASSPTPSSMSVQRGEPARRVLSDKTSDAGPVVVPLPEDDSFNVNLLTEDVIGSFNMRHRVIQLGLLAVGGILVVVLGYVGLSFFETSINKDVQETKAQTIAVKAATDALQPKLIEARQVSERLETIEQLIDKHIRWTRFFDRLEHYTLPQVTYGTGFSGSLTTTLNFSATTDSFERLAQQYLVYKQAVATGDFISDFTINGATKTVQEKSEIVSFNVAVTLVPALFENPELTAIPSSPAP